MNEDRNSQNYENGFNTYSRNDNTMSKMDMMRRMMQQSNSNSDSVESFNNNRGRMSNYRNMDRQNNPMCEFLEMFNSRSKRQAAGGDIDLGDARRAAQRPEGGDAGG